MMPTTHVSDVIKERAVLLFAIVKGKTVDVGQVIHNSICHAIQRGSTGGLPYPSLIYGLYKRAKVTWDEVLQPPKAVIDHATISRYKVWEGGASHPRGAGFIDAINSPIANEPS